MCRFSSEWVDVQKNVKQFWKQHAKAILMYQKRLETETAFNFTSSLSFLSFYWTKTMSRISCKNQCMLDFGFLLNKECANCALLKCLLVMVNQSAFFVWTTSYFFISIRAGRNVAHNLPSCLKRRIVSEHVRMKTSASVSIWSRSESVISGPEQISRLSRQHNRVAAAHTSVANWISVMLDDWN